MFFNQCHRTQLLKSGDQQSQRHPVVWQKLIMLVQPRYPEIPDNPYTNLNVKIATYSSSFGDQSN